MAQQPHGRHPTNRQDVVNWLFQPNPTLDAFAHGAGDAFTFGLADRGSAALKAAILDRRRGESLEAAYARHMAVERAQDAREERHHGTARKAGQVGGTLAQVGLLGLGEAAIAGGVRVAEATPLLAREWAALSAAGGAGGMAGQTLSDLSNRRLSPLGDYAGSAIGGAVGAAGSSFGLGSIAGAGAGAATSVAQDLANGRPISVDRAREAAFMGAAPGAVAGRAGRSVSRNWSTDEKERAGEFASRIRTAARGQKTVSTQKTPEHLPGGGHTKPDQRVSNGDLVESKFGYNNHLSYRQRQAHRELKNYRVDSTTPADVGALFAFPMAQAGFRSNHAEDGWPPTD